MSDFKVDKSRIKKIQRSLIFGIIIMFLMSVLIDWFALDSLKYKIFLFIICIFNILFFCLILKSLNEIIRLNKFKTINNLKIEDDAIVLATNIEEKYKLIKSSIQEINPIYKCTNHIQINTDNRDSFLFVF